MSWSLRFAEPIVLADGAKLSTLGDAVAHLGKTIPKSDHDAPSVTTAAELLTLAADTTDRSSLPVSRRCKRSIEEWSEFSILIAKKRIGAAAS